MPLSPMEPITLPEAGDGTRANRRRARRRRVAFPLVSLVLALAVPALAYVGFRTLIRSEEGNSVGQRRPAVGDLTLVAGAVIPPTPTSLVLLRGPEGTVEGLTILSSWPAGGGGVVFVPVDAVPGTGPDAAAAGVVQELERLLSVRIETTVELDDAGWARVTGPAESLLVDNPDPLAGFATGSIDVVPSRVGEYLRARRPGESDLARLVRHQALWEGWLSRVRADDEAGPADTDPALGRSVRRLASSSVVYRTLPPDPVEARLLVAQLMPGALTLAADRPRVRLLTAAGTDVLLPAARRLAGAGVEIVLVGRARRGSDTELAYHQSPGREIAGRMQRALGVGEIRLRRQDVEAFEVTVVIGDDFEEGGSPG